MLATGNAGSRTIDRAGETRDPRSRDPHAACGCGSCRGVADNLVCVRSVFSHSPDCAGATARCSDAGGSLHAVFAHAATDPAVGAATRVFAATGHDGPAGCVDVVVTGVAAGRASLS